jgi:hypothetical protein
LKKSFPLLSLVSTTLSRPLVACVVCFGQSADKNVGRAYFWGIIVMLACTAALLSAIGFTIYRLEVAHQKASKEV